MNAFRGCRSMSKWATFLKPVRDHGVSDIRSIFREDLDTITNSASFRRLQAKAQVFPLEKSDFYRTRLTHSIEVMTIAEAIGNGVVDIIMKKEIGSGDLLTEDEKALIGNVPIILRAASLIHDIGNPPFGHISEEVIADWFTANLRKIVYSEETKKYIYTEMNNLASNNLGQNLSRECALDLTSFDGNTYVFRTVRCLENGIYGQGMNLSYPLMATIVKYPAKYVSKRYEMQAAAGSKKKKKVKISHFIDDHPLYESIQKTLELDENRHPLTFVLEASDDIAYLTADMEDACRKGLLNVGLIRSKLLQGSKENPCDGITDALDCLNRIEKEVVKSHKPIPGSSSSNDQALIIRQFRVYLKGDLLTKVKCAFEEHYEDIVNLQFYGELLESPDTKGLVEVLRSLLREYVYYSPEIVKTKIEACEIVNSLMREFTLSVLNCHFESNGHNEDESSLKYLLLSDHYRRYYAHCENTAKMQRRKREKAASGRKDEEKLRKEAQVTFDQLSNYYKLMLVMDNVVGMSDPYALSIYKIIRAM